MTTTRKRPPLAAFAPILALEGYTRTAVSRHDSHLVRLRASSLNGCRYCLAMHRRVARKDGMGADLVRAAEHWPDHPDVLAADDLAVLRLTDAVTRIDGEESVPDELWDEIVRHRGEKGAGQILVEIVTINAWNRIAITTRQDPATLKGTVPEDLQG